jgi:RNA polymerase sigma factor (sigma-70 family)
VADAVALSLRSLYERYGRQIYSYCYHQLRSREEAEDAVQTTFMNAFRGLKSGTVPHAEQAWLFAIAQNVCFSRRTSAWRRRRVESESDFDLVQEVVPSRETSSSVELIGLEDALAAMPENQRRAILLREWQGLSYREIGDELALSQSAVETLIFRARRALAKALDEPAPKRRVGTGLSLGPLLGGLKSLLTGSTAVKAVAVAVAAGTATIAATKAERPLVQRHHAKRVARTVPVLHRRSLATATHASRAASARLHTTAVRRAEAATHMTAAALAAHGTAARASAEPAPSAPAPAPAAPATPPPAAEPPQSDPPSTASPLPTPTAVTPPQTTEPPAPAPEPTPTPPAPHAPEPPAPPAATPDPPVQPAPNGNGEANGNGDKAKTDNGVGNGGVPGNGKGKDKGK